MGIIEKISIKQIQALDLDPDSPLIISDADEVILQFARALEAYLTTHNLYIDFVDYRLFGNVKDQKNHALIPKERVFELVRKFLLEAAHLCKPVNGAVAALKRLSTKAQIVILSNTPHIARDSRASALKNCGLGYPLITNAGHKGPAVSNITMHHRAPVIFLDDIPTHINSVGVHAPDVHRIHFVADPRLSKLLDDAEDCHVRINNWDKAETYINSYLDNAAKGAVSVTKI
jgi:hypothetical protein